MIFNKHVNTHLDLPGRLLKGLFGAGLDTLLIGDVGLVLMDKELNVLATGLSMLLLLEGPGACESPTAWLANPWAEYETL